MSGKIHPLMEIECSKCQQKFHSSKEDMTVCPDCLRDEFAVTAARLDGEEHAELLAQHEASRRRQIARAKMMGSIYASGKAFSMVGKLRFILSLVVFLICCLLFVISDKRSGISFLTELDIESQRLISLAFCVVAAVLIATCSIRFRKAMCIVAACMLCAGWFMPDMLAASIRNRQRLEEEAAAKSRKAELIEAGRQAAKGKASGPLLTEEDLKVFYTMKSSSNRFANYAVFIDNQDSRVRGLVRDALNRLLQAEYTRAYTRANGALYVMANVPGERKNISKFLSRFGKVTYASPERGVYEVRFDADRANFVSQYPSEVLTSPLNNAYVTANISELKCMDPMRVRMSARSLAASNVSYLRREIRDGLVKVLQEPWASEPDTYSALVEALVTYANRGDKVVVQLTLDFFENHRISKREIAPIVTQFLIREKPDAMVIPIVDFWCENPIAWNDSLNQLGNRVQTPLVARLNNTSNIRLITSIIKYLERHGTEEALPSVERFLEYPDSIIRHSARATQKAIHARKIK